MVRNSFPAVALLLLVALAAVQPGAAELVERGLDAALGPGEQGHSDCPDGCRCDSRGIDCSSSCDDCACCHGTLQAVAPSVEPRVAACEVSAALPSFASRIESGARPRVYHPPRFSAAC